MNDLSRLRTFLAVAKAGSFSGAARDIGQSTTGVSRHLKDLEGALGTRLFNRTTRRVTLTEAGEILLAEGGRLIEDADALADRLGSLQTGARGLLRITAPASFGARHLMPAVAGFRRRYPDVTLDLSFTDRKVDLVEEGVDLALRIGRAETGALRMRRLAAARLVVVAAPSLLEGLDFVPTVATLDRLPCLIDRNLTTRDRWPLSDGRNGVSLVPVSGPITLDDAEAVRTAAVEGLGLALLPSFLVGDDVRSGHLRILFADEVCLETDLTILYAETRAPSAKVRVFIDHLATVFRDPPYWDRGLFSDPPENAAE